MLRHKSWCLLWITVFVIPFGLFILNSNMNLTWACFALQAGLAAFVPPLLLVLVWSKLTSKGLIIGRMFYCQYYTLDYSENASYFSLFLKIKKQSCTIDVIFLLISVRILYHSFKIRTPGKHVLTSSPSQFKTHYLHL